MWGQILLKFPAREVICGHGHEQKFKYPYPRDSKIIQMLYPRAKAIDQNPSLCPASPPLPPPRRLDIDRCIRLFKMLFYMIVNLYLVIIN